MTHDPRYASIEEIMNGSPFDIVDSPWGHIERWRASTLATGTMGALSSVYDLVRADATAQAARADATEARNALIQHLCSKVDAAHTRLDNIVAELAAEREARRADEARQAKLDEEEIEFPPDLGETPPSRATADDTHQYQPGGELHTLEPSEEPDPDLEVEDAADQGALPEELSKNVPPAPSTYPNFELPKPPVVAQPVAISLNKE